MVDSSAIDAALMALLGADTVLLGLMPNGIYWEEAAPGSTRYVRVSLIEAADEAQFGGRAIEDLVYQIEAVAKGTTNADVRAAAQRLDELLEDQPLVVPGYQIMSMSRERRIRATEVDPVDPTMRWHHRGGYYRVQMALTASASAWRPHAATHAVGGGDTVNVTTLGGYPGDTLTFLRGDGSFAVPPGGGGGGGTGDVVGPGASTAGHVATYADGTGLLLADSGLLAIDLVLTTDPRLADSRPALAHALTHAEGASDPITIAEAQVTNLVTDLAGKASLTDPRFTDARTPTAHAPTHGSGQSDPITITEAQVTNLVADLASKVSTTDPRLTDARTPTAHHATHEDGGADEITIAQSQVTGLVSGLAGTEKLANKNVANGYAGLDASLKLAGAQQTYGTTANTAAQGNDSRLSNARTPTAHEASHHNGGGDALSVLALAGYPGGATTFLRADGTFATPSSASGTVSGPALSVVGRVATWNDVTGTLLADGGVLLSSLVVTTDPRLTDARTPTLHAASHGPGGADALQLTAAARVLGRGSSGAGAVQELTIGAGLVLTGTDLTAPGARNSALVNYTFNTATVEPPAAGQVRLDSAFPHTAATKLWMRFVSADGQDVYWGVMIISPGSSILLQDKDDHTKYVRFTTTALPIDKGTYAEVPVAWQANGTAIATAAQVLMQSTAITTQVHHTTHEAGGSDALVLDKLAAPSDVVTLNASLTAHGLMQKYPGGTTLFLRADGTFAAPPGGAPTAHAATHKAGGSDVIRLDELAAAQADVLFATNATICRNTVDGADSGALRFTGGGAYTSSGSRGSSIALAGNEFVASGNTIPGGVSLQLGDVAGAYLGVFGGSGGGALFLKIDSAGLNIPSPGYHNIGPNRRSDVALWISGNFNASSGVIGYSQTLAITTNITPAANDTIYGVNLQPGLVKAATGTHPLVVSLYVQPTSVTGSGAVITETATAYISGPSGAGVNNYALHVAGGVSRFDGTVSTASVLLGGTGNGNIWLDTADGADNRAMVLSAANGVGASRGASVILYGNETGGLGGGQIQLIPGTGVGGAGSSGLSIYRSDGSTLALNIDGVTGDLALGGNAVIRRNTTAGSDNGYVGINAAGDSAGSVSRGASIWIYGNQHANPGWIYISPGSTATAGVGIYGQSGSRFEFTGLDGRIKHVASNGIRHAWFDCTAANGGYVSISRSNTETLNLGTRPATLGAGVAADAAIYSPSGDIYIQAQTNVYCITMYNSTTGVSANMNIDNSGVLRRFSSSRRYKRDIRPLDDWRCLLALEPVSYVHIADGETERLGLIAEQVAAVDPRLAVFGSDGRAEEVTYAQITAPMIKAIQDLHARLTALEGQHG